MLPNHLDLGVIQRYVVNATDKIKREAVKEV